MNKYSGDRSFATVSRRGVVRLLDRNHKYHNTVQFETANVARDCLLHNGFVETDDPTPEKRDVSRYLRTDGFTKRNVEFWKCFPVVKWWGVALLLATGLMGLMAFEWAKECLCVKNPGIPMAMTVGETIACGSIAAVVFGANVTAIVWIGRLLA